MRAVKNKLSKFENMRALDPVVGCVPPGSPSDSWEKAKKKSNSIDTLKKHMTMRGLWPRSASSEKWEGGEFSRNVPRDLIVTKRDIVGEREGASVIAFAHSDRRRRVVDRKSEKKYSDSDVIRSLFTFRAIFFFAPCNFFCFILSGLWIGVAVYEQSSSVRHQSRSSQSRCRLVSIVRFWVICQPAHTRARSIQTGFILVRFFVLFSPLWNKEKLQKRKLIIASVGRRLRGVKRVQSI